MTVLTNTIDAITAKDEAYREKARDHLSQLTMPHWALGRLMDLAVDLSGMTRSLSPKVNRRTVFVFSADHGVCEEGTSLYPAEVTAQMVHNFLRGGAGINALARQSATRVVAVDMGVNDPLEQVAGNENFLSRKIRRGTSNLSRGPAMGRDEAVKAVETGIQIALDAGDRTDVFGTGDMGIGNTTPSAAIVSVVTGLPPAEVTGRGTGIDGDQLRNKVAVIERAIEINRPSSKDGLDLLAKVGGFEIGGIAGLILGAARLRRPVVVDGFISTAGALIASLLCPASRDFMVAAHKSVEQGHGAALKKLRLEPLLDLNLRLGEGTGAAMAMNILAASVAVLTEVATFAQAGVSEADAS